MKTCDPEWIITTYDSSKQRNICFKDLLKLRPQIDSLMLLFDYNSFYVNVDGRYFIINGGRRIQPTAFSMMVKPTVLYSKRRTRTMTVNGGSKSTDVISYLLGVEGELDGQMRQLLLHISGDGKLWVWRDGR